MPSGDINLTKSLTLDHSAEGFLSETLETLLVVVINICASGTVSLCGIVTNVISLIIFYSQGLRSTINVSFFAMTLADLGSLTCQQWVSICVNPLLQNADIAFDISSLQFFTGAFPREAFARVTCMIIAFTTGERCLCVASPLRVATIITPRITIIYVVFVYSFMVCCIAPVYCTINISWKFSKDTRKTIPGLSFTNSTAGVLSSVNLVMAFSGFLSFLAVTIFTTVLVVKLKQAKLWRQTLKIDPEKLSLSNKDVRTIRLVAFIASNFIVCYLPSLCLLVLAVVNPMFLVTGKYADLAFVVWTVAAFLEVGHSSVNIVFYLKMSTKYKRSFTALFARRGK